MAGVKNLAMRMKVRKFLRKKEHRGWSDRDIAKECECSRGTVKAVRMEMIASGQHEPLEGTSGGPERNYKPGAVARGGYVYDENGSIIPVAAWERRQKGRSRA